MNRERNNDMAADAGSLIRTFARGDDDAYGDWVRRHGGYVLTARSGPTVEYMLHDAECGHLELTPGRWSLTTRPRRCAPSRQPLIEWTKQQTGAPPLLCQNCM